MTCRRSAVGPLVIEIPRYVPGLADALPGAGGDAGPTMAIVSSSAQTRSLEMPRPKDASDPLCRSTQSGAVASFASVSASPWRR